MSSEMRAHTTAELLALYDANGGDWCKIARAVEERFLARTEAGADGAVAWLVRCRRTGRVVWSDPSRSTAEGYARQIAHRMPDNTLDTEVIPLYTHPQDASGDAERYRWLKSKLLSADFEPDDYVGLTFALPAGSHVSANLDATLDAAMQAKEPAE